ncbi:MAG: hypothetical protein AAGF86_17790, partial [Pseudomonadota bacterium]
MAETLATFELSSPPLISADPAPDLVADLQGDCEPLTELFSSYPALRDFAEAVACNSGYLKRLMERDREFAVRCFTEPPAEVMEEVRDTTRAAWAEAEGQDDLMQRLRKGKARAALVTGLCDLAG